MLEATKFAHLKELSNKSNFKGSTGGFEAKKTTVRNMAPTTEQKGC